jgi:hypothetical protein
MDAPVDPEGRRHEALKGEGNHDSPWPRVILAGPSRNQDSRSLTDFGSLRTV